MIRRLPKRRNAWTHKLQSGVPVIVTEMYLPQQYARKATFVEALENSLDANKIKEHFNERPQAAIKRCLPDKLRSPVKYATLKDRILTKRRTFGGYSVYDILGAFAGKQGLSYDANSCVRIIDPIEVPQAKKDLTNKKLTTLLRLRKEDRDGLFQAAIRSLCALRQHHNAWPNLNSILHPTLTERNEAGLPPADLTGVSKESRQRIQAIAQSAAIQEIVRYFDDWIDEGSFLLYGFLGYHLHEAGPKEEEIWLTSHFAVVNVYKRRRRAKQ